MEEKKEIENVFNRIWRLPKELQLLILSYIPIHQLSILFRTCHFWKEFQLDQNLWRNIYLLNFPYQHEIQGSICWKSECKKMKTRRWLFYEQRDGILFLNNGLTLKRYNIIFSSSNYNIFDSKFDFIPSCRCETVFYSGKHYWEINVNKYKDRYLSPLGLGISNSNMDTKRHVGYCLENGLSYESGGVILNRLCMFNGMKKIIEGDCIGFYLDMDTPGFRIFHNGEVEFSDHLLKDPRYLLEYISSSSQRTITFGISPSVTLPGSSDMITANFNAVIELDGETIGFNGVLNK